MRQPYNTIAIMITFLILSCIYVNAWGQELPKEQVVRAIIGEASNQGFNGMFAIACAIQNRGTLKGVYGLNAKFVDNEPKWIWDMAEKAYNKSLKEDITNGATHWENIKAFGKPYWALSMEKVYEYKDHIFYREK